MVSVAIKSPSYLELPDQLELVYTALPYFWATSSFFCGHCSKLLNL